MLHVCLWNLTVSRTTSRILLSMFTTQNILRHLCEPSYRWLNGPCLVGWHETRPI